MYKNILISFSAVLLISGCGGGNSSTTINLSPDSLSKYENRPDMPSNTSNQPLVTYQTNSSIAKIPQSDVNRLKSAGYKNPQNLCKIGNDKIAFTHNTNQGKEFCIYDLKQNRQISSIKNFQGGQIVQINGNNIYFNNGIYVNVENPWWVQAKRYQEIPQSTTHKYSGSVEERLRNRYGSRLISYHYTYAHGGIFVEVKNGDKIDLHLLDANTLQDEKIITSYYGKMSQIIGLKGGLVKLVDSYGNEVIYDYLENRQISNSTNNQSNHSGDNLSDLELIKYSLKRYYEANSAWNFDKILSSNKLDNYRYLIKGLAYTPGDDYHVLYIVNIQNRNDVKVTEIKHANIFTGEFINLISINRNNHTLLYRYGMHYGDSDDYFDITYDYINLYEVTSNHHSYNDYNANNNGSSNSNDVYSTISSKLNNLITYTYSKQGGGIFAIGTKNGQYSFYRFDAKTLALEKSFYNVGLNRNYTIYGIDALSNGRFRIYTSGGNYIFNYFNGNLSYENSSYSDEHSYDNNPSYTNSNNDVYSMISSKLNNLITYSYSYQGGGIFAIGTKNGQYSFYRFDAKTLNLEKSFYNVGLNRNYTINGIDALPNGNFKIYTSGGTFIFNYFNGTLSR